jgi:hypothetical protein
MAKLRSDPAKDSQANWMGGALAPSIRQPQPALWGAARAGAAPGFDSANTSLPGTRAYIGVGAKFPAHPELSAKARLASGYRQREPVGLQAHYSVNSGLRRPLAGLRAG